MESVTALLLSFPIGIAANLGAEVLLKLQKGIKWKDLENLFINSFLDALKKEDKKYKGGLKDFRGKIKKNKKKILELFTTDVTIENTGLFFTEIKEEKYRQKVAERIIKEFSPGDNFRVVFVAIVKQCLENYEKAFLDKMNQEEGIKLIFKEQLHQTSELTTITTLVKQLLSEKTSKEDLKAYHEELKDLMLELIRIFSDDNAKTLVPKKPVKKLVKKKQKQIKILSITASPEGENYILYEQEQDTLLEVFKDFDRELVFLDMPDPVKSTLTEIREHLEDGYHDILHLTAHGGINEKGTGVLSLEDHQGNREPVTGEELIKVLNPTPKIVILSACHSARQEPELMPTARSLFEAGIETVIGMKKSVSQLAAIEFNAAFFNALCQKQTVNQAFASGKQAILMGEQRRIKEIPGWDAVNEYEIPQLLAKDENLTVDNFSEHRIEAPGRPESHHFLGAKYLERGFIGRRQVLRDIFRGIENKQGAVVLKGPGGIGKSTLTTRTAANLRRKGYDFIVARGETTIEQILEIISRKAAALGVKDAEKVYAANAEPNEKLTWFLDQFLLKQKLVIILDNFEENQEEAKAGEFKKERLEEFLWFFRDSLQHHETFLFFSTRYALPGFDSPDITKNIPEFTTVEFRKMLLNSRALKQLDGKSVKNLIEDIGGNPRALELLDKIAYKKYKKREFTWEQLKDLIPALRQRIIEKKAKGDDFTPLFLDTLFGYLSESQRRLLDILCIYREPVPVEAAAAQGIMMEDDDCAKLEDLSLLECIDLEDKDLYYIHRLTAQYLLQQIKAAQRKKYHKKAAGYFAALRDEEGKIFLDDLIEARWHWLRAGEWNQAAEITFDLSSYLRNRGYTHWAMELLVELELEKLKEEYRAIVHNRIGILHGEFFGEYEQALFHYNQALAINEKLDNLKGVSASLHQIGMIYQDKGDYDAALSQYQKAKEVFEKIGDIKGVSDSLHQIGIIYHYKGDYNAALNEYQKSLEIKEKIGDIKGVSSSLHQIGIIYQNKGDYNAAINVYQKSLEIREKIGDIKGVAYSMHQIGMIYQYKGDYDAALTQYQKAMEVFEKIGDIKGVSSSLHQIGMIYQYKGDYDAALKQYQKSMEIAEKIGDIKGVSDSLHQIGNIYYLKGDYDAALTNYQKSMEIAEKIGDIKGVSMSLHQIGMIYQDKGDYDAALTNYQKSMEIKEKIGDIKGVSYSLHQIGMIYQDKGDYDAALTQYQKAKEVFEKIGDIKGVSSSLHQIGRIYQERGDYDAALKQYQKSMEIKEKIGDIKGVSDSLHQIGNIYYLKGDYDAALTHYQKAKEVFEKIGDIFSASMCMAQMGKLYFNQNKFETALELFIQAFLVFAKIGSPYANQARKDIARVREKLPEDQFNAILKKFNLTPEDLP
jgi:tetratricopeptide (TPR) repeat protein